MGYPELLGWVDASGEGVGGCWLPRKDTPKPTIWRLEWPKKIAAQADNANNPSRVLVYKRSGNVRKSSGMAHVGSNSLH